MGNNYPKINLLGSKVKKMPNSYVVVNNNVDIGIQNLQNDYENIDYSITANDYVKQNGDINLDGKVDMQDVTALQHNMINGNQDRALQWVKNEFATNGYNKYYEDDELIAALSGDINKPEQVTDTYSQSQMDSSDWKKQEEKYKRIVDLKTTIDQYINKSEYETVLKYQYDLNGDGIVSIKDIETLQKYIVNDDIESLVDGNTLNKYKISVYSKSKSEYENMKKRIEDKIKKGDFDKAKYEEKPLTAEEEKRLIENFGSLDKASEWYNDNILYLDFLIDSLSKEIKMKPYNDINETSKYQNWLKRDSHYSKQDIKTIEEYGNYVWFGSQYSYDRIYVSKNMNPILFFQYYNEKGEINFDRNIKSKSEYPGLDDNLRMAHMDEYYFYYIYMTKDQINMYNYLYETEGKDVAERYLDTIKDDLNKLRGLNDARDFISTLDTSDKNELKNSLKNVFCTSGQGLGDGVDSFFSNIGQFFEENKIQTAEEYKKMFIAYLLKENGLLENVYNIGSGAGQIISIVAIQAVVSFLTGGAGLSISIGGTTAAAAHGLSTAGARKHQALIDNKDELTSEIYGIVNGLSVFALDKFLSSAVTKVFDVGKMKEWILTSIDGGFYVVGMDVTDAVTRAVILGEEIDITQFAGNSIKDFFIGFFATSMIMGASNLIGKIYVKYKGKKMTLSADKLREYMDLHPEATDSEIIAHGQLDGFDVEAFDAKPQAERIKYVKNAFEVGESLDYLLGSYKFKEDLVKLDNNSIQKLLNKTNSIKSADEIWNSLSINQRNTFTNSLKIKNEKLYENYAKTKIERYKQSEANFSNFWADSNSVNIEDIIVFNKNELREKAFGELTVQLTQKGTKKILIETTEEVLNSLQKHEKLPLKKTLNQESYNKMSDIWKANSNGKISVYAFGDVVIPESQYNVLRKNSKVFDEHGNCINVRELEKLLGVSSLIDTKAQKKQININNLAIDNNTLKSLMLFENGESSILACTI